MASDPVIGQSLVHRRPQGRGGEGNEGQVYNVQGQLQAGHGAQWLEGTRTQGTEHLHGTQGRITLPSFLPSLFFPFSLGWMARCSWQLAIGNWQVGGCSEMMRVEREEADRRSDQV